MVGFTVHGHACQVPESAGIFVQFPLLHFEGVKFCISSFFAHDVLEHSGEVIDHMVPDVFMPISIGIYASLDIVVNFLYLIVNPFIDVGSSDVS